jgi:hypothetical protein
MLSLSKDDGGKMRVASEVKLALRLTSSLSRTTLHSKLPPFHCPVPKPLADLKHLNKFTKCPIQHRFTVP